MDCNLQEEEEIIKRQIQESVEVSLRYDTLEEIRDHWKNKFLEVEMFLRQNRIPFD